MMVNKKGGVKPSQSYDESRRDISDINARIEPNSVDISHGKQVQQLMFH